MAVIGGIVFALGVVSLKEGGINLLGVVFVMLGMAMMIRERVTIDLDGQTITRRIGIFVPIIKRQQVYYDDSSMIRVSRAPSGFRSRSRLFRYPVRVATSQESIVVHKYLDPDDATRLSNVLSAFLKRPGQEDGISRY